MNIFNDYISGKTQKEIRDELNNKGLKNANGREFTINNISKILTNRRYVGNYIYKDVVIENGIPAIVLNDVFDKVQEMIAVNKRAPSRHKAVDDYLLTTKLYCGKCKSFMVGEGGNARGRRYSYYKCVNTKRNKTCDKKAVKKDWIEDIVIYQFMKFIDDDSLIEMLVNKILSIQGKESPMLKSLKKQLAQPTQPPKKKVDMLKLLPLISNTIGFVSGILSIIFGTKIKNYNNTYLAGYVSSFNYGGAAYTGIQNAAADTGNNVKAVYHLIQNSDMFLLITIGLIAISAFFSKLIKAVMDFKSSE